MIKEKEIIKKIDEMEEKIDNQNKFIEKIKTSLPKYGLDLKNLKTTPHVIEKNILVEKTNIVRDEGKRNSNTNTNSTEKQIENQITEESLSKKETKFPCLNHIDSNHLQDIPQYARGRVSIEKINEAIDEMNKIVSTKYSLLELPLSKLSESNLSKRRSFLNQEKSLSKYYRDSIKKPFFFSEADLKGTKMGLDATSKNIIQILKHIGYLKEYVGKLYVFIL